jgi:hypothetical protein
VIEFYDSVNPENIPAAAQYACLYGDGMYEAPREEADRFRHRKWITVLGNSWCHIADYENGNHVFEFPGSLRSWAQKRHEKMRRAIVYCDRANLARAIKDLDGERCYWWIPTLDNRRWTPEQLAADIKDKWHLDIPASRIWGNQYTGGQSALYDISDLFQRW